MQKKKRKLTKHKSVESIYRVEALPQYICKPALIGT